MLSCFVVPLDILPDIGDFSVPIENGLLGTVGTAGTDGAVTIIVVACATRDLRL